MGESLGTMGCFNMAQSSQKEKIMVVSYEKAKKVVEDLLKEGRNVERAELGLQGDWDWNSTEIYDGKEFHEYDAWCTSTWATPTLEVYFVDGPMESFECFEWEDIESGK